MKKTNKKETIYDGKTVIVMNSNIEDLEKELSQRIVRFWYTKKSGERREAIGTRCLSLIPKEYHPYGAKQRTCERVLNYWDAERGGWRGLIRLRFVGFQVVMKKNTECDYQN